MPIPRVPSLALAITDADTLTAAQLAALSAQLRAMIASVLPGAQLEVRVARQSAGRGLVVDLPGYQVMYDGQPAGLSHTEFELFAYLVTNSRLALSRRTLLGITGGDSLRAIDVHVSRVRGKLGRFGSQIVTVRGIGYRFDPHPAVRVVTMRAA